MAKRRALSIEDLSADQQELFDVLSQGTDLACVLIGENYLEEMLATLIRTRLIDHEVVEDMLRDQNRALSTMANRTDMALSLGLISALAYADLGHIRKIRNRFAHSHLQSTFADREAVEHARSLKYCDLFKVTGLMASIEAPGIDQPARNARGRFMFTVVRLSQEFLSTARHTTRLSQKPAPKVTGKSVVEPKEGRP